MHWCPQRRIVNSRGIDKHTTHVSSSELIAAGFAGPLKLGEASDAANTTVTVGEGAGAGEAAAAATPVALRSAAALSSAGSGAAGETPRIWTPGASGIRNAGAR